MKKYGIVAALVAATLMLNACSKKKEAERGRADTGVVAPVIPPKGNTATNPATAPGNRGVLDSTKYYLGAGVAKATRKAWFTLAYSEEIKNELILWLDRGRQQLGEHTGATCMRLVNVSFVFQDGSTSEAEYIEFTNSKCAEGLSLEDESKIKFTLPTKYIAGSTGKWEIFSQNPSDQIKIGEWSNVTDFGYRLDQLCDYRVSSSYADACTVYFDQAKILFNGIELF